MNYSIKNYMNMIQRAFTTRKGVKLGSALYELDEEYSRLNNQVDEFLNTYLNQWFCDILFINNYRNGYQFWAKVNTAQKCLILMNLNSILADLSSNGVITVELGVECELDPYNQPINVFYYHTSKDCYLSYDFNTKFAKFRLIDGRNINSQFLKISQNDDYFKHRFPKELEYDKINNVCYYSRDDFNLS
jgi:hypothetical protein